MQQGGLVVFLAIRLDTGIPVVVYPLLHGPVHFIYGEIGSLMLVLWSMLSNRPDWAYIQQKYRGRGVEQSRTGCTLVMSVSGGASLVGSE